MFNDVVILNSYQHGFNMHMRWFDAKMFLTGLALDVITMCKTKNSRDLGNCLDSTIEIPYYDDNIKEYCSGVHGAILSNVIRSKALILFNFMENIIKDESEDSLYLFCDRVSSSGKREWEIFCKALEEYEKREMLEYELISRNPPFDRVPFNKYCEEFRKIMTHGRSKEEDE